MILTKERCNHVKGKKQKKGGGSAADRVGF